jgi:O-antigen/teichoic acid export membrane protein
MSAPSAVRRVGWGIADQALASFTNFALTVVVARQVSTDSFGAFALAMSVYIFVGVVARGITSEPLLVRFSQVPRAQWSAGVGQSTGATVLVGLSSGAVVLAVGIALGGAVGHVMDALAVSLPGVLFQDHVRFAMFAASRQVEAAVNDAVWAAVQLPLVSALLASGRREPWLLVLAWGVSGTAAGLLGMAQLRRLPDVSASVRWFREQRDLWPFFALDNGLVQSVNVLVLSVMAAAGSLSQAGSFRAAVTAFAPLTVLALGINTVLVPDLVRTARDERSQLVRRSVHRSLAFGLVVLVYGVGVWFLPAGVGRQLVGATWPHAHRLLPLVTIDCVATAVVMGPATAIRVLGRGRRCLGIRCGVSAARLAVGALGSALGGAMGAAGSFAAIGPVQGAVWYQQLTATVRRDAAGTVESPLPSAEAAVLS